MKKLTLALFALCFSSVYGQTQSECYECMAAEYIEQVALPCFRDSYESALELEDWDEDWTFTMDEAIEMGEAGLGSVLGFFRAGAGEGMLWKMAQMDIADRFRMYAQLRADCVPSFLVRVERLQNQ